MNFLAIFDRNGNFVRGFDEPVLIATELQKIGADFQIWPLPEGSGELSTEEEVFSFYSKQIDELKEKYNFRQVDLVKLDSEHPKKDELRKKFLREHTHSDFETRFFVEGEGLFYISQGDKVFGIWCGPGTLINVPAGAKHWFDMGEKPNFACIRFFREEDGWVADYTDSKLEEKFPLFEQFRDRFLRGD